jgi:pyruvoyl-dependent arginine decarboxylase (PvlArgDC)
MKITIKLLQEHQEALKEKFDENEGIAYTNVSMTPFSVARHYGGCKVEGKHFVYNSEDDSLIREDVAIWLSKQIGKKQRKRKVKAE